MRKRVLSFLLAVTLMVSLLPVSVAAADADFEAEVKSAVSQMLKDYAKKVDQPNADDEAFNDYFIHAFFGNGKKMTLSEKSPMTAALFNSCLLQEALTTEITAAILKMQELRKDRLYGYGSTNWHNYLYSYYATGYLKKGEKTYSGSVGKLMKPTNPGGTSQHFTGVGNENDKLQTLLTGGLNTSFELNKIQLVDGKATYSVAIQLSDTFDFTGTYDDVANQGYDTSKDETLKDFGWLMTFMGIDEFDWSFKTTLRVEVPFVCDHIDHNYRWVMDLSSLTFRSEDGNGFDRNETTRQEYLDKTTYSEPTIRYYYTIDKPAFLSHDRPWVMEWDQIGLNTHQFSAASATLYAQIYNFVWLTFSHKVPLGDGTEKALTVLLGVKVAGKFKYHSTHRYTTMLENVVNEDGTNMIYISIYDHDLGETVLPPEPMNDLYYKLPDEKTQTRKDSASQLANGMDLILGSIGTKSSGWLKGSTKGLEVRIWENGKNPVPDVGVPVEPTCTEQGGMQHKCEDCGCDYLTETIPALGHSYGEYVPDNNPSCVEDATKTRTCTRCGEKDSVAIPDTALGHSFGEYVYDNNASCTADGTQTRKCTVCGEKDTVTAPDTATGHSYESAVTEPTYTEQGYTTYTCTVCGDSYKDDYTDVKQHSYVGVVTEPTCTAQGFTTYTCSECGDSYVDDYTDLAEHTPVIDPAVKPTCSEKGKTEGSHCGVCGYVIKKQALISTNDNHTMEESIVKMPTYDEPGQLAYICTGCGKTDYMEIPPLNKPLVNPFTDVTESDWFFEPVLWAVQEGVTGGKTETTFAPNEGCTRAQVVTFLWAANGKPEPTTENPFTDVANDAWYLKPVLWAVEQGITTGVTATEFGPDQTCTRAQIATFLWAANGKPAVSTGSEFVDVGDTDWYSTPIIWAKENDVTGGIGNGKFGPNDTCTRAQVVTFLKKVYANK